MDILLEGDRRLGEGIEEIIVDGAAMVGRDCAVAAIQLNDGTIVTGESKRAPGDPFNPEVASLLAWGRAFITVGHLLEEYGQELSNENCPKSK